MRSLPFTYPDVPEYDSCKTSYMLGPNLLVVAFTKEATIPTGGWYEWRTDEFVKGPASKSVKVTPQWGGALYVKAGAIIPTWPEVECIDAGWNKDLILEAYAGASGASELYEDDGLSLAYEKGAGARIPLTLADSGKDVTVQIGKRTGNFKGAPLRSVTLRLHGLNAKPASAQVAGNPAEGAWCEKTKTFTIGPVDVGPSGCEFKIAR